jgi:hypothetical protein
MIVLFGLEPRSVVVAHMLEKLRGTKAEMFSPERKFFFDQVEDARTVDFEAVYSEYREKHGKIDFLDDMKLYDVMSGEIFWALRFGALDRGPLVLQMLDKMGSEGTKGYLSESGPEAKEMRFRVKRVLAEFNRALRYVKFTKHDEARLSLASATFESDIADMVLRAEAARSPDGYTVAVYGEKTVSMIVNGRPFMARTQKVPLSPERKGFKHFWQGLPETGGELICKDDLHDIKEFPKILLPKGQDTPEKVLDRQTATLDDFAE